jgi:hypothetical protein
MKYFEYSLLFLSSLAVSILLGCASAPKMSGSERIAIVSYALRRSITRSGESYDIGRAKRTRWSASRNSIFFSS